MTRLLATLLLALAACTASPVPTVGTVPTIGATDTAQPVFTATATRTTMPTQAEYTARPTSTEYPVQATYTLLPTYTPQPTYTAVPTFTPTPTATMRSEGQRTPRARLIPVGVASFADGVCWPKFFYSESSGHETRITEDAAGFRMCVAMVSAGQRKGLQ